MTVYGVAIIFFVKTARFWPIFQKPAHFPAHQLFQNPHIARKSQFLIDKSWLSESPHTWVKTRQPARFAGTRTLWQLCWCRIIFSSSCPSLHSRLSQGHSLRECRLGQEEEMMLQQSAPVAARDECSNNNKVPRFAPKRFCNFRSEFSVAINKSTFN